MTFMNVSIDSISHLQGNQFGIKLLPDFNSKYFPPYHTRFIRVSIELLDKDFLSWLSRYNSEFKERNFSLYDARGSVIQGGYYQIPSYYFAREFSSIEGYTVSRDNDIFAEARRPSPYDESKIVGEQIIEANNIGELNSLKQHIKNTYLYGFSVGQGDMLLLITAAKNAYLIDTNIYSDAGRSRYTDKIKSILHTHGMNVRKIKGLICTHKHIDHIRGADQLISSNAFDIEYLIMNLDYNHPTIAVQRLCMSAQRHISKWVNLNKPCHIIEGETQICFKNPTDVTRLAPDINDSSIVMCVRHGGANGSLLYLTGDAGSPVLEDCLSCSMLTHCTPSVLKVSHHGSRTGTSKQLLHILSPKYAFISAGYSRKYKHPHAECVNELAKNKITSYLSCRQQMTIEYCCTRSKIGIRLLP